MKIRLNKKINLGNVVATPGAIAAFDKSGDFYSVYLNRHMQCDWGDMPDEDWKLNNDSVKDGSRLMSSYLLKDNTKIWIITDAGHEVTTILLPDEY
jgi:hypothetical protein